MNYTQYLDFLEKKLKGSFDIIRDNEINNFKFDLYAEYHLRNERYIMTKKATVYAMEFNEYCFVKFYSDLNIIKIEDYFNSLIELVDVVVKPNSEHMSSIITGVIVLEDKPGKDIIEMVKRSKFHKGFAFGFRGWVDIRLLLVTLNEEFVISNKKGKEVCKVYSV